MSPNLAITLINAGLFAQDANPHLTEDLPGGHKRFTNWAKISRALSAATNFPVENLQPPDDLMHFVETSTTSEGALDLDQNRANVLSQLLTQYIQNNTARFTDLTQFANLLPEDCITVTTTNLEVSHVIKFLEHVEKVSQRIAVDKKIEPIQYNAGSIEIVFVADADTAMQAAHMAIELARIYGDTAAKSFNSMLQTVQKLMQPDAKADATKIWREAIADEFFRFNEPPSAESVARIKQGAELISDEAPDVKAIWESHSLKIYHHPTGLAIVGASPALALAAIQKALESDGTETTEKR